MANARIYVENAVGRLYYSILNHRFPVTFAHVADQIVHICAFLTNFLGPIAK